MTVTCKFCFNTFEAKRKTATFCCDLHRTLYGKLSLEGKQQKELNLKTLNNSFGTFEDQQKENEKFGYFTPANQPELGKFGDYGLPFIDKQGQPTEKAAEEAKVSVKVFEWEKEQLKIQNDIIKDYNRLYPWIKDVEEYCQIAGCAPQDLIDAHKLFLYPKMVKKDSKKEEIPVRGIIQSGGITQMSNQALAIRRKKLGLDEK